MHKNKWKNIQKRMLAAMLGTIIAMSSFQTVYATKQDVEAAKKKVSSIEEEKKKVQATIKNLEGLKNDAAAYVKELDGSLTKLEGELDQLSAQIGTKEQEISDTGVALEQARSLVYTAEADIPQYERAVKQTRLSLDILLGETPQAADSTGSGLRLLADRHPADIPVGLPSELLKRRPDIMEARYNMLQAAANAGVARGARFPSIALTAKGGIASNSIKGLTAANPWAWDALGSLTQPLFAFGKLRRSEMAAMERYTQAAKTYEQTVLTAFADVEKALVAIATYRTQTERSCELVVSNDRIATMTQALYRSGLSDYLDVIDAERSLYQSQMELVNIAAQQYINYVNLCKALGGGW